MKIINVMAASLDGKIARHSSESEADRRRYGFLNQADHDHVRTLLTTADAVVLGGSSLRASGKVWALRNAKGIFPIWVVMTRSGIPKNFAFWQQSEVPRWLVSPKRLEVDAVPPANISYLNYAEEDPVTFTLKALANAGAKRILLFGGGGINRLFYIAERVDEIWLTLCPFIIAEEGAVSLIDTGLDKPLALRLLSSHTEANHVFLNYVVNKSNSL